MKLIKKITFLGVLLVCLLVVQNTYAQKGHQRSNLKKLKIELNLTDQQAADWQVITDKYQAQIQVLKQESTEQGTNREEMKTIRHAQRQEIMALLTPEQKAVLRAKKEERHTAHKERWKNVDKEAMKAELKAYKAQNIMPTILQQRTKLEQALSTTDKTTIAALRPVFTAIDAEKKGLKKKYKKEGERPNREMMQQLRSEMKKKYAEEKATLVALSEKYAPIINTLKEEIAPQIEQWKKESHEIMKKYIPQDENAKPHHKSHKGRHGGKFGKHLQGERAIHHFLLLDPEQKQMTTTGVATTTLSNYPNPTTTNNQLTYEVRNAGNIKIELRDDNGAKTKVLLNEFKEVGTHSLSVDLGNLRDGIYYYVLTDQQGVLTKKVVLAR